MFVLPLQTLNLHQEEDQNLLVFTKDYHRKHRVSQRFWLGYPQLSGVGLEAEPRGGAVERIPVSSAGTAAAPELTVGPVLSETQRK